MYLNAKSTHPWRKPTQMVPISQAMTMVSILDVRSLSTRRNQFHLRSIPSPSVRSKNQPREEKEGAIYDSFKGHRWWWCPFFFTKRGLSGSKRGWLIHFLGDWHVLPSIKPSPHRVCLSPWQKKAPQNWAQERPKAYFREACRHALMVVSRMLWLEHVCIVGGWRSGNVPPVPRVDSETDKPSALINLDSHEKLISGDLLPLEQSAKEEKMEE